jgi:hypothetical protein
MGAFRARIVTLMIVAFVLIAVLAVWLIAAVFVVALCVAAAEGDRQLHARVRRARRARSAARIAGGRFARQRFSQP